MAEEFLRTIPILRIFDEQKAREFYIDFMGFTVDFEHRFEENTPLYMQVHRGELVLHLSEHFGDCCPGSTVFVWMTDIDQFHEELISKRYKNLRPGIETAEWGARVMQVIDPFGNRIRFSQDLKNDQTA